MLASLDLFSGVGGLSHALRGFSIPLLYCDDDPICRATLEARIAAGDIPAAPVLNATDDTREIINTALNTKIEVDMITVGPSCSSLASFKGILTILAHTRAPMMFMQNQRSILKSDRGRDFTSILRRFRSLGYRVAWCVLSADNVGAWHKRKTWFALAYRPAKLRDHALRIPRSSSAFKRFRWSHLTKPDRTIGLGRAVCNRETDVLDDSKRRLSLLSDEIVPDCSRLGFMFLFSGGTVTDIRVRSMKHVQFLPDTVQSTNTFSDFGITSKTGRSSTIMLGSNPFKPTRVRCRGLPHFNKGMNPHFVEFIMGFPRNWTSMRMSIMR